MSLVRNVTARSFTPLKGWLIFRPDPDVTRFGVLHLSYGMVQANTIGSVLLHNSTYWWDCVEDRLDGKIVLVEKWAWKRLLLNGEQFYIVPEQGVLGVLVDERTGEDMTRDELIAELKDRVADMVKDTITTNRELSDEDIENIDGAIEGIAASTIEGIEGEDDDEEETEEEEEPAKE